MRHVDEGTLHAYLDARDRPAAGALDPGRREQVERHLAECATCAAALADAQRIRARAGDILQGAGPVAPELPAFPALAGPAAPPRPQRRRAWVPLAWAASVMLAAGAGWMGSELWRTEATQLPPTESGVTAPAPAAAGLKRPPAAVLDAAAEPAGQQAAAASPPPSARGAAVGGAVAAAPGGAAEADEPAAQEAVAASAPAMAAAPREQRREASVDFRVRGADALASGGKARADALASNEKARAVRAFADPPAAAVQLEALVVTGVVHPYPGDEDVAWTDISVAEARRLLADTLLLIPAAEVERVARDSAGRVLVRQRTTAGEIELVQWRTPEPPAAPGPPVQGHAADGSPFAVSRRGGVTVALKAAAGRVESLVQQLERHRP